MFCIFINQAGCSLFLKHQNVHCAVPSELTGFQPIQPNVLHQTKRAQRGRWLQIGPTKTQRHQVCFKASDYYCNQLFSPNSILWQSLEPSLERAMSLWWQFCMMAP